MKHGVVIAEGNRWNTKRIYNNGFVLGTYRKLPKQIRFRSEMVNDFNQHLCGGWFLSDIPDQIQAIVGQLVSKRKPFGSIGALGEPNLEKIEAFQSTLSKAGLETRVEQDDSSWELLACHPIRVRDIGDLSALKEDYVQNLSREWSQDIAAQIDDYADAELSSFFDGWDSPPLALPLTGLVLGYPIENTV